jgi:hypothetical protein
MRWGDAPAAPTGWVAACLVVLMFAAPAHGKNEYVIFGAGGRSCGSWLQVRSQALPDSAVLQSWVLGYITSVNANLLTSSEDVTSGASSDALFTWIDTYCGAHPLDSIARATAALLDSMLAKNKVQ